jgi:FkbH-like protein
MNYSEIIKLNNSLEGQIQGGEYKVAILSNIMVHQSKDIFEYLLRTESLNAKVILGEYDNIVQDSKRLQDADAVIFFWEACNFIDGLQYKIDLFSEKEFNDIVDKVKFEIDIVLSALKNTPTVIINRFSSLVFDQFNLFEGNLKRLVDILNRYLESNIRENSSLFNIDGVISRLSIKSATDLRYYYSSKALYSVDFYREYFQNIQHIFFAANGKTKKALIFDCDNTLWKGTLGEDGFNGIKIFQEIQYLALQLAKKGVIIGLCSKNNLEDVDNVLENHSDMILRNDDIVIKKINWSNKVINLKSIAEDLNIGLDSLVFIDDSSFEIGLVKQELPSVKVFQVPIKEYEYSLMMKKVSNLFYYPSKTKEDRVKTQMYKDQAKRTKEKNKAVDMESYLTSLDILITIHINNLAQLSRISQLTQKTNQFNLTTKRYSESEIKSLILNDDKIVISIEVDDKYGSSGLTGLAILCKKTSKIDTLLLSCRILGRNIEYKFIDIVVDIAKKNNLNLMKSEYIKTLKNQQVKDFYNLCGFNVVFESDDSTQYHLEINNYKNNKIKYIGVNNGS